MQIAASQALLRQVHAKTVNLHTRTEMLDVIVSGGRATGIVTRDLVTGAVCATTGHAVVLASGGYGNVFFRPRGQELERHGHLAGAPARGLFASPAFIQFHPTALPVNSEWQSKTILMSESLRNDGRIWVPTEGRRRAQSQRHSRRRTRLLPRTHVSGVRQLSPRDVSSRAARTQIESGAVSVR